MNKLAINTVGDELEAAADFCRSEKVGLEVTAFYRPGNLDGDVPSLIEQHNRAVADISPLISHGPFLDLVATSFDPAIVEVSRRRHETALAATVKVGASIYVAHTNYTPMIRNPSYRQNWIKRMLTFWMPLADEACKHGVAIYLENLWEPTPEIQANLISEANHPSLKASFDNGHALVFSDIPANRWISELGSGLAHCHLHDNHGEIDTHNVIGDGKENWTALLTSLQQHAPDAIAVIECDRIEKNQASLSRIRGFLTKECSPNSTSLRSAESADS